MHRAPRLGLVRLAMLAGCSACFGPTDVSDRFRVELDPLRPLLLVGESEELSARLVGPDGVVKGAALRYQTSDALVVALNPFTLVMEGVSIGTADITVTAGAFADAVPATQRIEVRPRLQVDSIAPREIPFGGVLRIYGIGLDQGAEVTVGGIRALFRDFEFADPLVRARGGVLSVAVAAPAPASSDLVVSVARESFRAGSVTVLQHDAYDPNTLAPAALGPITPSSLLLNPALALLPRTDRFGFPGVAPDWFTFDNPVRQDVTVTVRPVGFAASLLVADRVIPSAAGEFGSYTFEGWTTGSDYRCDGLLVDRSRALVDRATVAALRDLPPGRYNVLIGLANVAGLTAPKAYGLSIVPAYGALLLPDEREEDDYCDLARPIELPTAPLQLSFDSVTDPDWFRFSIPAAGGTATFTITAANPREDPSLVIVQDDRPTSLAVRTRSEPGAGGVKSLTTALDPGDYLLLVSNPLGMATAYTLSASVTP